MSEFKFPGYYSTVVEGVRIGSSVSAIVLAAHEQWVLYTVSGIIYGASYVADPKMRELGRAFAEGIKNAAQDIYKYHEKNSQNV